MKVLTWVRYVQWCTESAHLRGLRELFDIRRIVRRHVGVVVDYIGEVTADLMSVSLGSKLS